MKPGDLVSVWGRTRPYRLVSSTTVHNSYGDPCPGWVIESADGVRHEAAESVLVACAPEVRPVARTTDPTTAHKAAERAQVRASFNAWLLLGAHIAAGERGLIGREHKAWTGLPYEAIGPRRKGLAERGWVADTGTERDAQAVWVATAAGVDAWALRPSEYVAALDAALSDARRTA